MAGDCVALETTRPAEELTLPFTQTIVKFPTFTVLQRLVRFNVVPLQMMSWLVPFAKQTSVKFTSMVALLISTFDVQFRAVSLHETVTLGAEKFPSDKLPLLAVALSDKTVLVEFAVPLSIGAAFARNIHTGSIKATIMATNNVNT